MPGSKTLTLTAEQLATLDERSRGLLALNQLINEDGVTRQELARACKYFFKDGFKKADANGDDILTPEEFKIALKSKFTPDEADLYRLAGAHHLSKDTVSVQMVEALATTGVKLALDNMDSDKDGVITCKEAQIPTKWAVGYFESFKNDEELIAQIAQNLDQQKTDDEVSQGINTKIIARQLWEKFMENTKEAAKADGNADYITIEEMAPLLESMQPATEEHAEKPTSVQKSTNPAKAVAVKR